MLRYRAVKPLVVFGTVFSVFHFVANSYVSVQDHLMNEIDYQVSTVVSDLAASAGFKRPHPEEELGLEDKIALEAKINGLNPDLVHAVIKVESNKNTWAKSRAGAMGLMQLMPETAKACGFKDGGEAYVPHRNVECGIWWLSNAIRDQGGNLVKGLQAYNGGPRCVNRCQESITYATKVISLFAQSAK